VLRAYKYRIYPTKEQQVKINQTLGVCRFVYNYMLAKKNEAYKKDKTKLSAFDLCYDLPDLKKEYPWIADVDSQAVQMAVKKIDSAFAKFFKGAGYPNFKKRGDRQSFLCPNNTRRIDWEKSTLTIPKIQNIPIRLSRKFEGQIRNVTISRTPSGKYFASILVKDGIKIPDLLPIEKDKCIGIDTGIKSFVISSDGRKFEPNRKLKANLKRLKALQRRASRKVKGSANRRKANKRVAGLHEKITNKRLDYIHKVTHNLTSENQAVSTIFVEDLNISGLLKNHNLAQAMSDVSLSKFYEILGYKCKWKGINLVKIGRFDPSSKRCSCCGEIKKTLSLSERNWTCEFCGAEHDRDDNAAENILWYGLEKIFNKNIGGQPKRACGVAGKSRSEEAGTRICVNKYVNAKTI